MNNGNRARSEDRLRTGIFENEPGATGKSKAHCGSGNRGRNSSGSSSSAAVEASSDDVVLRLLRQAALAHEHMLQALRDENFEMRSQLEAADSRSNVPRRAASKDRKMLQGDCHTVPSEGKLLRPHCSVTESQRHSLTSSHEFGVEDATDAAEARGDDGAAPAGAGMLADVLGDGRVAAEIDAAITLVCLDMSPKDKSESNVERISTNTGGVERLSTSTEHGADRFSCSTAGGEWTFELRSVWLEARLSLTRRDLEKKRQKKVNAARRADMEQARRRNTKASKVSDEIGDGPIGCIFIHPSSMKKFCWDVLAMLGMMFDIITLPLILAFEVFTNDKTFSCMVWFTRVFWTTDIVTSFLTGYYTKDEQQVVMKGRMIAINYAKTWLIPDVAIVSVDWFFFAAGSVDAKTFARASRLNRLFRGLRLLRMMRLLKILKYKRFIEDIASSEVAHANLNVVRLLSMIVVVSHLMACLWYYVGTVDKRGWVSQQLWIEDTKEYRYATAYHWAVMHLGVGEVEIEPQTTLERFVAIGVVLCGIVFFSLLVSSATNSLSQLQMNQAEHRRQHGLFRRFCRQNKVPRELFNRIMRFLQFEMVELQKQRIDHHHVGLLDKLSGPLYTELLYIMYSPILQKHSVFHMLCRTWPLVAQKISSQVVSSKYLASSDILFDQGEEADNVFWVMSGQMEYMRENWPPLTVVEEECWISEPALWTSWLYQGSLQAIGPCRLLVVDVSQFVEVMLTAPGTWQDITSYAESFVDYLNNYASDFCFDVTHDHCFDAFTGYQGVAEKSTV